MVSSNSSKNNNVAIVIINWVPGLPEPVKADARKSCPPAPCDGFLFNRTVTRYRDMWGLGGLGL